MSFWKKINLVLFLISTLILILTFGLFEFKCFDTCGFYANRALIKPSIAAFLPLSGILLILMLFKVRIFELWLKYLASWYIPLTLFFVTNIDPYASSVLSVDRSPAAFQLMLIFAVITFVFAIGYTVIAKLRGW